MSEADPSAIDAGTLQRLSDFLAASLTELSVESARRIQEEVKELEPFSSDELWAAITVSTEANLAAGLRALGRGFELPNRLPEPTLRFAQASARDGIPLAALLRAYRIAHSVILERWLDSVLSMGLAPGPTHVLLTEGSRFVFAYIDRQSALVAEEHERERDALLRTREQRLVHVVRDLLDGADLNLDAFGYDLRGHHIGLVARGPDAVRAIRDAGSSLGRHVLTVTTSTDAWGWLHSTAPFDATTLSTIAGLAPENGTVVGVGDPASGREGFTSSHRQALSAARVAGRLGQAVVSFSAVALEAIAWADAGPGADERAAAFVARELGPLAERGRRARTLRVTLAAYFEADQIAAAAAVALGVHDQTVTYRLRSIEEQLGHPVRAHRAALELALRLHAVLDGAAGFRR